MERRTGYSVTVLSEGDRTEWVELDAVVLSSYSTVPFRPSYSTVSLRR